MPDARARFPLTLHWLGEAAPPAATLDAFVKAVCDAHAKGDIPHRAVRDLVRYEAALAELRPVAPVNSPLPEEDVPLVLAPDARVLVYGAGLPEALAQLRAGGRPAPRPARGWLLLWRPEGAPAPRELVLERDEGWLLESFRRPIPAADAVEDEADRALLAKLWAEGVLVRG